MTLIDKAEALAPCPFCGGGVSVTTTERVGGIVCDAPSECIGSGLLIVFDLEDMETALAAWNRRAIPARGVGVPTDQPEAGEIRALIVNAKWKPCVHGGGWWVAQDADGRPVSLAPDGFAALTAAMDPAIAERAGEVLPRLRKADEYEPLGHDGWEAADLITALLSQNASHVNETPKSEHEETDVLTDYSLAPHLQKIVEGAKTAPQWDMQLDRLAPTDADSKPVWPDFIAPPKYENPDPRWVDPALPDFRLIWKIARECGYAVGLHGSMKRDCDLIAVPWTDEAVLAFDLIYRLCEALNAQVLGPVAGKPHGRLGWNLQVDGYVKVIDISVVPRTQDRAALTETATTEEGNG